MKAISVGAKNAPKISRCGGEIIIRYGYEELGNGYVKYMECSYRTMPSKESLKAEIESYIAEHEINDVYNEKDYFKL